MIVIAFYCCCKSLKIPLNQTTWHAAKATTTYSASVLKSAVMGFFFSELHSIVPDPKVKTWTETLLRSSIQLA